MKLFVLSNVPGAQPVGQEAAVPTAKWEDICHLKGRILFVDHDRFREVSRWKHEERKRPFLVRNRRFDILGSSTTLCGALKILRREAEHFSLLDAAWKAK